MAASLTIQVSSPPGLIKHDIEFFTADEWTSDTEMQLMQRVHQLLTMMRPFGKALALSIQVEVTDVQSAVFMIKKKIGKPCEINTQKLTPREIEIIGLIMSGYTNQDIAEKLFISYETVKSHRKHILLKTGAKNTAALINYYHRTFFDK